MIADLHCGACGEPMDSSDSLVLHLEQCEAAKALLPPFIHIAFGGSDVGHDAAHLLRSASMYSSMIREYAQSIASDIDSFARSEIHARLCAKLGLDYATFRPFEDESITEIPNQQEAERILWRAIGKELMLRIGK